MLLICPTMSCNLNCKYCYEKTEGERRYERGFTDTKIFDSDMKIFSEFKKKLTNPNKKINFCLHGGEPTVASIDLLKEMKEIFYFHNADIKKQSGSIVTNGVRLIEDKDYLNDLCGIVDNVTLSYDLGSQQFDRTPNLTFEDYFELMKNLQERGVAFSILSQITNNTLKNYKKYVEEFIRIQENFKDSISRIRTHVVFDAESEKKYWTINPIEFAKKISKELDKYSINNNIDILERAYGRYLFLKDGHTLSSCCSSGFPICAGNYDNHLGMMTYAINDFFLTCPGACGDESIKTIDKNNFYDSYINKSKVLRKMYIDKMNNICRDCKYIKNCGYCLFDFFRDNFFDGKNCKREMKKITRGIK